MLFFFFFNDTATTEIYTLSLHDALPISLRAPPRRACRPGIPKAGPSSCPASSISPFITPHALRPTHYLKGEIDRSEEHTSELQSLAYLVCRLLLEKKKSIHALPSGRRMS